MNDMGLDSDGEERLGSEEERFDADEQHDADAHYDFWENPEMVKARPQWYLYCNFFNF